MDREVDVTCRKDLEELWKTTRELNKAIRRLITEVHYTLNRIREVLEEKYMLSYDDSYDIRESLDLMIRLLHELEGNGGDP